MTSRLGRAAALLFALFFLLALLEFGDVRAQEARPAKLPTFDMTYDVGIVASEKSAHVEIILGAGSEVVEWIIFRFDPMRHRAIEADGELREVENGIEWKPPPGGGSIRYVFSIDHLRDDNAYDARCAKSWAIFRGRDLVPTMRVRTVPSARSRSRMRLRLPEEWSVALPYTRFRGGIYALDNPRTRVDRPNGWFAFGKLGIVRETIEGSRIAIAAPAGQGVRRMDILALLSWTLPSLREVFGDLPKRLQIVLAGDPMWRGGLSGPNSVFVHADRPLIGQDSSSPLIHELVHSLMHARAGRDGDWVVEGIAEYYSIAILRRSGTLSASRYESAIEAMRKRAEGAGDLFASSVDVPTRSRAVEILMEIDDAIRKATGGASNLDSAVRHLTEANERVTTERFRAAVSEAAGRDLSEIFDPLVADRD